MAAKDRYTAVPVTIWANEKWKRTLDRDDQWLFGLLWTWPTRNYGGFVPLIPAVWATCAADTTTEDVLQILKNLAAERMVLTDPDTAELWLRPFIRHDAMHSPNIYVSALNKIRECQSPTLRRAAWNEVLSIHPPALKSDKPEVRDKMHQRISDAFEELRVQMSPEEGHRL